MVENAALHAITLSQRPLLVCDIDDVVLEFLRPFEVYLQQLGHRLAPNSFRLHGNILCQTSQQPLADQQVSEIILEFFNRQEEWQTVFSTAQDSLQIISERADIVFLTSMPTQFYPQRRRLLDRLGLPYPLLASEEPKGPIVKALHRARSLPTAFVDDMAHNLHSVGEHMPDCLLVQLGPKFEIHRHAPPPPANVICTSDWTEASHHVLAHFDRHDLPPEAL
ncbi:hypothetical protein NAC44_07605 [Allorhizobium sp. BGMRC 0089]|uniref:hypothetical protein n=1 Tax=Allorhizobium sonneratiae TaxID=2934936 RepID=UPI0020333B96|nr:hypothetical protein [Allorhizobium sonneratiae]MCM2292191.1 hypothetical protein [Allorhizobium sonneratiae]